MRPAPFQYHRAEELDHALDLLARFGEDCRPLAGGQSLVPMMNLRLALPQHLVDINRLGLADIARTDGVMRVGALVRHERYLNDAVVAEFFPALREAAACIGHPTIRRHGTLGGSFAHADPTAELPAMAALHDAVIVAASKDGERRIDATDFFVGAHTTALQPHELLTAVEFPIPAQSSAASFVELSERRGDFATVSVGSLIAYSQKEITAAAIVCSGAELTPIRAAEVEGLLLGESLDRPPAAEAGQRLAASVEPISNHLASADYRKSLVAELTRQAIETACSRALAL